MTKQEILIEASNQVDKGNGQAIADLLERQMKKVELPEKLQKIVDKIGNNPIDEPGLYESITEKGKDNSRFKLVLKFITEEEMDEYSLDVLSNFSKTVVNKVSSRKDENGVYKQTEKTKGWEMPKPSHVKKFEKLVREFVEMNENDTEELVKQNEKLTKLLFKSAKIEEEGLSEWEKTLVIEQTNDAMRGALNSFLGTN